MEKNIPLSNLQLVSDRIKYLNYEVDLEKVVNQELKPDLQIDVSRQFIFEDEDKPHKALIELLVKFRLKKHKKVLLKLDLKIEGEFWGNPNFPKPDFKKLAIKSGIINLLTITRAKIIAMSSLFGFSTPIYIPLINVKEIIEKEIKLLEQESSE